MSDPLRLRALATRPKWMEMPTNSPVALISDTSQSNAKNGMNAVDLKNSAASLHFARIRNVPVRSVSAIDDVQRPPAPGEWPSGQAGFINASRSLRTSSCP